MNKLGNFKDLLFGTVLLMGLILNFPAPAQELVMLEAPENYQLYPRDISDSARVTLSGNVSGFSSELIELRTYIDNELLETKTKEIDFDEEGSADFSIDQQIKAGLFQYKFELLFSDEKEKLLLYTADSVVSGDAYIITGQSNSHASSSDLSFNSPYIRSFGVKTGYNSYTERHKEHRWGNAKGDSPDLKGIGGWYTDNPFGVGIWGMYLGQKLVENHKFPICIINGGSGNSTIEENMPTHFQADLNTSFGRLIYRVHEAGLTEGIKAILWHQGESNTNESYSRYLENFDTLYLAWKSNFPSLEKIYIFQIHPGCGYGFQSEVRNSQVQIANIYDDVDIMSTVGLPGHDGCHYTEKGYFAMAESIYPFLSRDFYGEKYDIPITPPKLLRAHWSKADDLLICLEFDQTIIWNQEQTVHDVSYSLRDYIYLDGVSGIINEVFTDDNKLYLKLNQPGKYNQITYLPGHFYEGTDICYEGPWILGANGIGALSFDSVKIEP